MIQLPETGFLRLGQIIGDAKAGIPPLIPVKKSAWWAGVRSGRYPKSIKLSPRVTVWRVEHNLGRLLSRDLIWFRRTLWPKRKQFDPRLVRLSGGFSTDFTANNQRWMPCVESMPR